ncbi:SDR family NAD(P)-dependent oxidoreductase [Coraliomargarita parva]|uniref:SDR family NAD(P)-dependent oxidoreductase n=1 Tax=Coraliomargarita parva TaxID=3014050 RepID=UPI0022B351BB|nr:SDR family NAD(P)-dependent oxidoreductase [Coraliomargarita parva]
MDFRANSSHFSEYGALVISGGSSGIGLGCLQKFRALCPRARVYNLSRSRPPGFVDNALNQHLACDLSQLGSIEGALQRLGELLADSSGRILLINNSGIGTNGRFQDIEPALHLAVVDLNIKGTVALTIGLLPLLTERGGKIVTIASTSAYQPTPRLTTYGAGKSFLLHWSLALGEDLAGSGVDTLAVCPGPTWTAFVEKAGFGSSPKALWGFQTVEAVVGEIFRAIAKGKRMVVTGWINRILASVSSIAPIRWSARVAGWIVSRA